jgi:hypothetical protein
MRTHVTDFFIYKWRYPIGYLFVAALVIIVVGSAVFTTPGGLRAEEMDSTVKSASLSVESLDASMVIHLPYHVLQRVTFMLFGVSTITIKLPSLIIGVLTVIGIFFLMRIWFRRSVAILTTILAATSTQFLFLVQDGTPAIMYSFIVVWLFLSGTLVTRGFAFNTFWKVVTGVLLASALYMPLGIYLVVAVLVAASLHPHIRYIIKHITKLRLILSLSLAALFVTPLLYACIVSPETLRTLLGINVSGFSFTDSAVNMGRLFAGFFSVPSSYVLTPLYSLGLVVLMTIGLWQLWTERHTARSYVVLILGCLLLPFIFIDSTQAHAVFPVAVILSGYGISHLIRSWYRLFPRNPYARVAGLVPLTIIILGMVYSGVIRYMHNYTYNPAVMAHFSDDIRLLDGTLSKLEKGTVVAVVTTSDELPFYNVVAHYDARFSATSGTANSPVVIVTHNAHTAGQQGNTIDTIVASARSADADRFYIYKTADK